MPKPKRIVCYAINGAGLGHLTRLRTVARWLRRYVALLDGQSPEVLFLTSSDASDSLADAGFAAFKIPSKTVARKTELSKLEYRRLAKHFVWNTLGVFTPDLLVVDTFPSGSFDELFQVLDGPFKSSFIYRNVNADYANRATFRSAVRMYDQVVAPHAQDESQRGGFAAHDGELTFSGEVVQFEHEDLLPPDVARTQLGIPTEKKLVYVSAGGGGDPDAENQLRALVVSLSSLDSVHLLVGAGPLYRGARLSGPNVTWFDGPSVAKYFGGVDAAVSAAGYNTFHELLYARVPTAFFYQKKVADDQRARIQTAVDAGACRLIDEVGDAGAIAAVVEDLLCSETAIQLRDACQQQLPTNGANRCAIELLRPLYSDERLDWAKQVLTPRIANCLEGLSSSSAVVANWIVPLMPADQIRAIASHAGFDGIMKQLSPLAASEVQQLLSQSAGSQSSSPQHHQQIESSLLELITAFDAWPEAERAPIADAALKTIQATMKRQPLSGELESDWSTWICAIVDTVKVLCVAEDSGLSAIDRMRLHRSFPRIVDADVLGAAGLFEHFLSGHVRRGTQPHEIDQAIQLLKLTHQRVTRSVLDTIVADKTDATLSPIPPNDGGV